MDGEGGVSSADEMTVNALAEKKRRLLSRVLAPTKRGKFDPRLFILKISFVDPDLKKNIFLQWIQNVLFPSRSTLNVFI
jgi:hypothetical protein